MSEVEIPWMDLAGAIPVREAGRAYFGTANMGACSREELRRQRTIAWKLQAAVQALRALSPAV